MPRDEWSRRHELRLSLRRCAHAEVRMPSFHHTVDFLPRAAYAHLRDSLGVMPAYHICEIAYSGWQTRHQRKKMAKCRLHSCRRRHGWRRKDAIQSPLRRRHGPFPMGGKPESTANISALQRFTGGGDTRR